MGIPVSMVVPTVPMRYHRLVVLVLAVCFAGACAGLGLAPVGGARPWMILAGMGGGMFPFSLVLVGYRSAGPATTVSLLVLWVALVVATVAGWLACTPRTVDDDIAAQPSEPAA